MDGDGIADARDLCAGTPAGSAVDARGCAVIDSINFAFDSSAIDSSADDRLNLTAATLAQNDGLRVRIEGHASRPGTPEANELVSRRRAERIRDGLVARGIDPSRIDVVALGDTRLTGTTNEANQRADITFLR